MRSSERLATIPRSLRAVPEPFALPACLAAMWIRIVLALAVAAVALLLSWPDGEVRPGAAAGASTAAAPADALSAAEPEPRRAVAEPVVDATFVSEGEETGVAADAVRDGVVILVLGQDRQALADAKLDVRWRKGWGKYGYDRGRTDARGRFPTTIAEYEMIDGVVLHDPELGNLEYWFDFLPMANDPRTVLVIAASVEPVAIRVVDQRGLPIAGASVAIEGGRFDGMPREHVLVPTKEDAMSDADGRVALRLPACAHTFKATADGYLTMYSLRATAPFAGRTLTLHLLDRRHLHDVAVTVLAPENAPTDYYFSASTQEVPADLPGLEPSGVEPVMMQLGYRREAPRQFVVQAPWLRWRCYAHNEGFAGSAEVAAFATEAKLEIKALPAPPRARVKCRLLLPDGQETHGDVMVHKTPDLVYGSRESVSPKDPFVVVEPGGKVCVSAWVYQYPPVVAGPIELTAGDHELTFQCVQPLSIRGRVVDEHGRPARATVNLRRPAGALRALAADVPAILADSASGDSLGIGEQGEGRFWFEYLGTGEHELCVSPEGLGWPARVRVMAGDQNVVVRLGTGLDDLVRVQGRVTMADSGQPVAGAQVRWLGEHWQGNSYTDADGRYTQVVRPGRLHPEVWARRCAVLHGGEEELAVGLVTRDLALVPSEPLFVRVRSASGKVPDVVIAGRDEHGRDLVFLDANGNFDGEVINVGSSGRVVLRGLPVTKFTLIVRENVGDDARPRTQEVEVPANTPRATEFAIVWAPAGKGS